MRSKKIICKGDKTDHGGTVIEGISTYLIQGREASGKGHMVECPLCKGSFPIIEGSENMKVQGIPIALEGMKTSCGAILIASQTTTSSI